MRYLIIFFFFLFSCTPKIAEKIEKPFGNETEIYFYFDENGDLVTGSKRSGVLGIETELQRTLNHFEMLFKDLGIEDEFYELTNKYKKTKTL